MADRSRVNFPDLQAGSNTLCQNGDSLGRAEANDPGGLGRNMERDFKSVCSGLWEKHLPMNLIKDWHSESKLFLFLFSSWGVISRYHHMPESLHLMAIRFCGNHLSVALEFSSLLSASPAMASHLVYGSCSLAGWGSPPPPPPVLPAPCMAAFNLSLLQPNRAFSMCLLTAYEPSVGSDSRKEGLSTHPSVSPTDCSWNPRRKCVEWFLEDTVK